MTILIIGLGLIGGSIGLELSRQLGVTTVGCDRDDSHRQVALKRGIVHQVQGWREAISKVNIILIATPVTAMEDLLPDILDHASDQQVVIDLGSTKQHLIDAVQQHPMRGRYVAAHPLAGTEHSGPRAAIHGLFEGKRNIICDVESSDPDAVDIAMKVFDSLGMITSTMRADEHDQHLAYVSHLSHVTSFALGLTVLDLEEDTDTIMRLAGTGFASTARLAKSNPSTWEAIFSKNTKPLTHAIDQYISHLQSMRAAIAAQDGEEMNRLMTIANSLTPYI